MWSGSTLYWLLGDYLGSTSLIIDDATEAGEARYYPWGKDRFTSGATPTSFKFTGQRYEDHYGFRLYYYGARWYARSASAKHNPQLGRFIGYLLGADTFVPNRWGCPRHLSTRWAQSATAMRRAKQIVDTQPALCARSLFNSNRSVKG